MKSQYILMADIIKSRDHSSSELMSDFTALISGINKRFAGDLISPLTITLGDEFQGIVSSMGSGLEIMISIEEELIRRKAGFKFRHILLHGKIETPINHEKAHGMIGEGLALAREGLSELKTSRNDRFEISVENEKLSDALEGIFLVYQSLVDDWKPRDYDLITAFLDHEDYKKVAAYLKKDVSLMWRREGTLKMREYFALKRSILTLGEL
jgi:hypothetical protein